MIEAPGSFELRREGMQLPDVLLTRIRPDGQSSIYQCQLVPAVRKKAPSRPCSPLFVAPGDFGRPRACLPAKIGALVIPFSKIVSAKPHHSFRIFRQSEPTACESINAPVRRRQPSFVIFRLLAFTTFTHQQKCRRRLRPRRSARAPDRSPTTLRRLRSGTLPRVMPSLARYVLRLSETLMHARIARRYEKLGIAKLDGARGVDGNDLGRI